MIKKALMSALALAAVTGMTPTEYRDQMLSQAKNE